VKLRLSLGSAILLLSLGGVLSCSNEPTTKAPVAAVAPSRVASETSSPVDVLTQHNDQQRSGANLQETILTPEKVRSGGFRRLFDWTVDGQIYTQPLYVSHIPYNGKTINLVIVGTTNNSVYAFQAPDANSSVQPSPDPIWQVKKNVLGWPLDYDYMPMQSEILGYNICPQIGIIATPVVDRQRGTVYVTAKSGDREHHPKEQYYRLFAIDLLTGKLKRSQEINATYPNMAPTWTFDPKYELQRASLLEANSRIYVAFASHQDTTPFHGWILAYDADSLKQEAAYCTTCDKTQIDPYGGGIWQAGAGPASDPDGNIYVITGDGSTGNSTYKGACQSGDILDQKTYRDLGTSFIKLDPSLKPLGAWTPANYKCINGTDADLGSAGPTYLPEQGVLLGGGKEGVLYAIKPEAMNGYHIGLCHKASYLHPPCGLDPIPDAFGPGYSTIQAAPIWEFDLLSGIFGIFRNYALMLGFHHIHGSPVRWRVHDSSGDHLLLYISAERDVLHAFEYPDAFLNTPSSGFPPGTTFQSRCRNSRFGMPGGFLTLSANGSQSDSGILWASMPRFNEDAWNSPVPGILRAYDAYPYVKGNLVEIWNSDNGTDIRDNCEEPSPSGESQVGLFAKFVPPTVAEGKVYLATFSGKLAVYGLAPTADFALAAEKAGYHANLTFEQTPSIVAAHVLRVSIRAKNTGQVVWQANTVALTSSMVPETWVKSAGDKQPLVLHRDVQHGQTYTLNFDLTYPQCISAFSVLWRLVHVGPGNMQSARNLFGSTPTWTFRSRRKQCNSVHQRLARLVTLVYQGRPISKSMRAELEQIKQDARLRSCIVADDLMRQTK
jgi:hypothetical protein